MKQIITFLLVIFMANFAIGQQSYPVYSGINKIKKPSSPKGADEISGEITTLSYYVPGETTTLIFTITIESPDFEFGDFVELTFPEGITPLDGSPFIGEAGDNQANYNGVNGQIISWGDDNNNFGGIYAGQSYDFWVEIACDEGLTGVHEITYFVSGDEWGVPPNEFSGTANISELPDAPDLAVTVTGIISTYYTVPLAQAVFVPEGSVQNYANDLTEATDFNLTIVDVYDENMPITIPLEYQETEYFTFPAYTATETGTLTFTYTANASNDLNTDNGTVVKEIEVDSTVLSFNNGDMIGYKSVGVPGAMLGNVFFIAAEDVITGVSFYLVNPTPGDIITARVYAFDGEPGDLIASTMDVIITTDSTEYTALFPTEVTLPEGNYLIALVEGDNFLTIAITSTPFVPNSSWVYFGDQWINAGDIGFTDTFILNGIFGEYTSPSFDIALEELTIPPYVTVGEVDITGVLKNLSGEVLTSIDIEYTVNGGEPVMESFTGLSVEPIGTYDFTFTTPAYLPEVGAYDIVVSISNANGNGPDVNPNNDQLGIIVNFMDYIPFKMVVGEEATGTWCGWCVRGIVYMEYMAETYPDTWIGIAVHNGDPMVVPEYDAGIGSWIPGYPSGLVDRSEVYDPAEFEQGFLERINEVAPAELMIENQSVVDGVLTFDVTATFYAKVANFRLNTVLVEDFVTGPPPGYNQANYYSGGAYGEMGGFELLPNPVPASDMVYMDVSRALLGGWDGIEGSLPDTVYAGETFNYEFSVVLDESWNYNNMEIVGMLINQTTGKIENACVDDLITSVSSMETNSDVSVYPNPAKDEVRISNIEHGNIYLYNINGQLVMERQNVKGSCKLDISKFENGTYILKIINNEETITTKVNVIK